LMHAWADAHVRHEAPSTVRDERTRLQAVAAVCRSWEQSSPGGTGWDGSSSDNDGTVQHRQMCRARQARRKGVRMQKPVVEPPQAERRLESGGSGPVSNARPPFWWATPASAYEWPTGGHGECLRRNHGEVAGEELGTDPVERLMVNVGTATEPPTLSASQAASGKACRLLMARWRGGGSVVVRGRESRPHGEGTQRVRSAGAGTPRGRR
jgi:hypothetical protein